MSYAQLDVHFDEATKYAELSLEHFGLMACAISYCNRLLTDGKLPLKAVRCFGNSPDRAGEIARDLVSKRIWKLTKTGFEVIGFLDHNPSKKDVETKRQLWRARQEKSRISRETSKNVTRDSRASLDDRKRVNLPFTTQSLHYTDTTLNSPTESIGETSSPTAPQLALVPDPPKSKSQKRKPRERRPETFPPPSDMPDDQVSAWLSERKLPNDSDVHHMLDWHRKNGKGSCDWLASLRTWMRNQKSFAERDLRASPTRIEGVRANGNTIQLPAKPGEFQYKGHDF